MTARHTLAATGVLALALAGCAAPGGHVPDRGPWHKAGADDTAWRVGHRACADEVELALLAEPYDSPLFRLTPSERRLRARAWARDAYRDCLIARGWQHPPGAEIRPPADIYYP